ncbi:peptidase M3 [Petrotoga sp. 8T1HF07.NaAc.6.1]|uniref:M3 family oligoendopeptidase n=1 Tax=Petrotoga sp. 8T1HF07.NaAc.6.1 TaxID=1351838 RepID=UPI00192AE27B|nr:M3 family oligoendopeptidase [Petrotoga sp. 8T1HF07.NaAc.6.1]MBL5981593.1 peptidase M3 [Petrotoga sp. 8T1HF07.NaAc.6.1]
MSRWDLTFFYSSPEDSQIKEDFEESLRQIKKLYQQYYDKLSNPSLTPHELKNFFQEFEKVLKMHNFTYQYCHLLYDSNTQDETAQKLYAMAKDYDSKIEMESSFWKPRLLKQNEKKLNELMYAEELKDYTHVLQKLIKSKSHILSEDAEKVLAAMYNSSRGGFEELYGRLTSSYTFKLEIDGELKELTDPQVRSLRRKPDVNLRRQAMKEFFKKYDEDSLLFEKIYNSIVKNYDTEASLRNYKEPISMRNFNNEVEDEIVETVIKVTTDRTPMVHQYYRWKGKRLGIEQTLADIYAPLAKVQKEYTFEEAQKIVLDSYYEFDEEIGEIAESFFKEKRIDSEIRKGKRGGAYTSYALPNRKPFILLNFTGTLADVSTLAHELGHGIHGTLASEQNIWNYHPPLTMAEVASVFGEMLVIDKILPTLSEEERTAYLASNVEGMFSTMFRQNMIARFEISSHNLIEQNGSASWKELAELYKKELEIMFGDSVIIPQEYYYEWASIPHIHRTPFYVYAYNFANLLVLALYQQYKVEGKSFAPKYKELLRSGAKDSPKELLKKIGIDISNKDFWEKGFEFIEREFISKLD